MLSQKLLSRFGIKTEADYAFSLALVIFVAFCAVLSLAVGWLLGLETFTRLRPGLPAMVPTTSFAFVMTALAAGALLLKYPAKTVVMFAGLVMVALWSEPLMRQIFGNVDSSDGVSPATRVSFSALAFCIATRATFSTRWQDIPTAVGLIFMMLPLIALVGYVFDATAIFSITLLTNMSVPTAVLMALMHLSLLYMDRASPWVGALISDKPGSRRIAAVVPYLLILCFGACYLGLRASEISGIDPNLRFAVMTIVLMFGILVGCAFVARNLNGLIESRRFARQLEMAQLALSHQKEMAKADAEKSAALGLVVSGVAHDFNNSLAIMRGNLDLVLEDPEYALDYLKEAMKAIDKASALNVQLLDYGRKNREVRKTHTLGPLLHNSIKAFQASLPAQLTFAVHNDCAEDTEMVVDALGFERSLLNLLLNARDAIPEAGSITVHLSHDTLSLGSAGRFNGGRGIAPGPYLLVSVTDTGVGMTPEVARQAVLPFFTTKGVGRGTGIGLASVDGFCQGMGGGLLIDSAPGVGTTVRMAFPMAEAPDAVRAASATQNATVEVLFVGLADAVYRETAVRCADAVFQLTRCETPCAALAHLETNGAPKLCLIGTLPEGAKSVAAVVRELNRIAPKLTVLPVSGNDVSVLDPNDPAVSGPSAVIRSISPV